MKKILEWIGLYMTNETSLTGIKITGMENKIVGIEKIDHVSFAKELNISEITNININIERDKKGDYFTTLLVQEEKATNVLDATDKKLIISTSDSIPIGKGLHFMVNQPQILASKQFDLIPERIKVIPISLNDSIYVNTFHRDKSFKITIKNLKIIIIELYEGAIPSEVKLLKTKPSTLKRGGSIWSISLHQKEQPIGV